MGRAIKQGLEYFPFDIDFFQIEIELKAPFLKINQLIIIMPVRLNF